MVLKSSISMAMRASSDDGRSARDSSCGQVPAQPAAVWQTGQLIRQRVLLRLFEHQGIVQRGPGLLGHALEQPAVVFAVVFRVDVIDGKHADEGVREVQRAHHGRPQVGMPVWTGGLEGGARVRIDERPPVAADPIGQAVVRYRAVDELWSVQSGAKRAGERLEDANRRRRGNSRTTARFSSAWRR